MTAHTGDMLGGRLPLLNTEQLTNAQHELRRRTLAESGARADAAGYRIADAQGRLIGPFNAWLRTPALAEPLAAWALAIAKAPLSAEVREVVILTIGAHWQASYELDAHAKAARLAGLSAPDVHALARGNAPAEVSQQAMVGHRVVATLIRGQPVDQELYNAAIDAFGVDALVALIALAGQYAHTSMVLNFFQVPAAA